jgi:hypothetical protein
VGDAGAIGALDGLTGLVVTAAGVGGHPRTLTPPRAYFVCPSAL